MARVWRIGLLLGLCGSASCRCQPEPTEPVPVPPDAGVAARACERGPRQLTIAPPGGARPAAASEDPSGGEDDIAPDAPIELGVGLAVGDHYWVTALRHEADGSMALLARVAMRDGGLPDRVIELERLHGEVSAPRLASDGKLTVVALQEATAGGHQVRLGRLAESGEVSGWALSPPQAADESSAFDVAVGGGRALLVWDEWSASDNRGVAQIASIGPDSDPVAPAGAALRLSDGSTDAESPRIAARAGGFWVTWIANAPLGPGERRIYDPDRGDEGDDEVSSVSSLSHGARWLEAMAVDEHGRPSSRALRITPADARVVGYDLIATEDGEALVAWRQGAPSPSADGGQIAALRLTPGGPGEVVWIRDGDLGAGSPGLISSGRAPAPWLTFPDSSDAPRLLRLLPESGSGQSSPEIALPWTGSAVLAAREQQPLLVALPRGHGVELSLVRCAPPTSPGDGAPRVR